MLTPVLYLPAGPCPGLHRPPRCKGPRGWPAALGTSWHCCLWCSCASSVLPSSPQCHTQSSRLPQSTGLTLSLGRPNTRNSRQPRFQKNIPLPPSTMQVFHTPHLGTRTSLPEPRLLPRQDKDSCIQIFVWLNTFWPPLPSLSLTHHSCLYCFSFPQVFARQQLYTNLKYKCIQNANG